MKGGKKPTISSPFENVYKLTCRIHIQERKESYNALTLEIDKILKWTEEQVLGTKFYVPKIVSKS